MTTTSTIQTDARAASPASHWTSGTRTAVAASFIAAGVLWVVAELIGFGLDGTTELSWMVSHQTLAGIGLAADILAVPFLTVSALAWFFLARPKSPKLAPTGAIMLLFGLTAQSVFNGVDNAQFQIVTSGKVSASAIVAALGSTPTASVSGITLMIMFYVGAFAGIIVLMVALWRSRTLPRTAVALVIAFQLAGAAGLPVPTTVIAAAGLIIMAVSLLRTRSIPAVTTSAP